MATPPRGHSHRHEITVYEKDPRPGRHSHTLDIDYDGARVAVTLFHVYNEPNYPGLSALFSHLGVDTVESDMSFPVSADGGRFEGLAEARRF